MMTPIIAKAIASFAAVPSARPTAAPTPARPAAARLRRTVNSPITAPTNGPTRTPKMPKNSPTMAPRVARVTARAEAPYRRAPNAPAMKSTTTANTVKAPSRPSDQGPMYWNYSAHAASSAPMNINGAPGKIGSRSPIAPMAISTPAAIHRTIVAASKLAQFKSGVRSFSLCHALSRTCVRDLMRQPSGVRTYTSS